MIMDDIYDNLENYNEVNIVQELRSENKELKTKLEECSSAMERLQTDFDKMAAEFKKLEMNYSSLLKTARAEIERKTHIIKNLNIEKDIMVLNSLQNIRQSKFQVQKEADIRLRNNSDSENVLSKPASKEKIHTQRLPEKRVPSEDKISSFGAEKRVPSEDKISSFSAEKLMPSAEDKISSINAEKRVQSEDKNILGFSADNKTKIGTKIDTKSKNEESANSKPQTKALGIGNRRKSMPVLSKEYSKYSSDEEYDDSGGTLNEKRSFAKISDRNRIDKGRRQNDDKRRDKAFTSSYDRYDNYEYRESGYRHKNNQFNRDRFRTPEEPEHRLRNKRYYSPKRSYRRDNRDLHNSHHYRPDYGRGKIVVSPVPDRYSRKRSRDRRSNHDRDAYDNYDREAHNNYERDSYENYERNVFKNYERDVLDNYEREVRENYERDVHENFSQNPCYYEEKLLPIDKINTDFDEPQSKRVKISLAEKFSDEDLPTDTNQLISCESPDYVSADNVSASLPVKEIMDTAATQLEDPRLVSKKYMTMKNGDNIMLSTVIGRNIELEIVNTKTWEKINIPRPLLYSETQCSKQLVKEVYMDLDNPLSNITSESGENLDWEANNELINVVPKSIQRDYEIKNKNQPGEINVLQGVNQNTEKIEHSSKLCYQSYKIQKSNYSISEVKECTNEMIHKKSSDNHCIKTYKDLKNTVRERTSSQNSLSDVTSDENISIDKDNFAGISKSLTNRKIVQNDLELSDDNVPPLNKITEEKSNKGSSFNKKKEKGKMHKQKKNKKVCDDTNFDSNNKIKEKEPVQGDIKIKFSDLFGDNSSLITPEDLQVATCEAHRQNQPLGQLDKYIDVEDTQNAVDLNFASISKTKSDISENIPCDADHKTNGNIETNNTSKPNFEKISLTIDSQETIESKKMVDSKQSNSNFTETHTNLKQASNSEESEQKKCKAQNLTSKRNKRNSIKSAESVEANRNEVDTCKNFKDKTVTKKGSLKVLQIEKDTTKKQIEIEAKLCKLETENKKINVGGDNTLPPQSEKLYDISKEKDTPASTVEKTELNFIKSKVNLDPTAIDGMNALLESNETTKADKNQEIHCNAAVCNEPGVKTVVISTGFQEMITESVETNLEYKLSRSQNDLITVLRIKEHSLKALATSTPQKECQDNLVQGDKIQEAVSSCNNTGLTSDNSITVTDKNDNDVPDVRIFVKRRRRVLKKPQ